MLAARGTLPWRAPFATPPRRGPRAIPAVHDRDTRALGPGADGQRAGAVPCARLVHLHDRECGRPHEPTGPGPAARLMHQDVDEHEQHEPERDGDEGPAPRSARQGRKPAKARDLLHPSVLASGSDAGSARCAASSGASLAGRGRPAPRRAVISARGASARRGGGRAGKAAALAAAGYALGDTKGHGQQAGGDAELPQP